MIQGSWNAGRRVFLAVVIGASGGCAVGAPPEIPWLDSVSAYEPTEAGWRLTDAAGAVMASLAIDGAPEPIDTAAGFYAEPPVIDDSIRAAFQPVPALPDPLEPVSTAELLGRWTPIDAPEGTDAQVEFRDSGSWGGSDGCNFNGGRWAIEGEGEMLTTSGFSTLIGCGNVPVPSWVASARLAGFDRDQLVLLDVSGTELGRLQRAD